MKHGRWQKLDEKQAEEAGRLYGDGFSIGALAHAFDVTRQSMWMLLRRRRVKMRPHLRFGEENHFHRGTSADDHAQNLLEEALEHGRLIRPEACENCGTSGEPFMDGRTPIQAHHDDYNKPLDVRWLCQRCHHEWHKTNRAIPLRKGGDAHDGSLPGPVDLICGGFP